MDLTEDTHFKMIYDSGEAVQSTLLGCLYAKILPSSRTLLENDQYVQAARATEADRFDYEWLRSSLESLEGFIPSEGLSEMFEVFNELYKYHIDFVTVTTKMAILRIHLSLISAILDYNDCKVLKYIDAAVDRRNSICSDEDLVPSFNITTFREMIEERNPGGSSFRSDLKYQYCLYKKQLEKAEKELSLFKKSLTVTTFLNNLKLALLHHQSHKLAVASRANRLHVQSRMRKASAVDRARRTSNSSWRSTSNGSSTCDKYAKIYEDNISNNHQFGMQSRIELTDAVINALGEIQDMYQTTMFGDQEDEELAKPKKVIPPGTVHNVDGLVWLHVDELEQQQEGDQMNKENEKLAFLDGVIIDESKYKLVRGPSVDD